MRAHRTDGAPASLSAAPGCHKPHASVCSWSSRYREPPGAWLDSKDIARTVLRRAQQHTAQPRERTCLRAAPRPSREPAVPRSASRTRGRPLCARPRPHTRLACACHAQTQRSAAAAATAKACARRQSRPDVKGRVDPPPLDVHGHAASHGGDGEQVCGGIETSIGHMRGQDQQKRAAGSVRVPGTGSAWAATGTATGCTPSRIITLPMFSHPSPKFFLGAFQTRCESHARQQRHAHS